MSPDRPVGYRAYTAAGRRPFSRSKRAYWDKSCNAWRISAGCPYNSTPLETPFCCHLSSSSRIVRRVLLYAKGHNRVPMYWKAKSRSQPFSPAFLRRMVCSSKAGAACKSLRTCSAARSCAPARDKAGGVGPVFKQSKHFPRGSGHVIHPRLFQTYERSHIYHPHPAPRVSAPQVNSSEPPKVST